MAKSKKRLRVAQPTKQHPHPKKSRSGPGQKSGPPPTKKSHSSKPIAPTIPFAPTDRILLVGEGDLSFARSLVAHHGCRHVTATVLEKSAAELSAKYPQAVENARAIDEGGGVVKYGVDATKMSPWIDKTTGKGTMDRIIFNFPHVGGKSTDVNRQVRYNQELLVSFFKRGIPSLAPNGTIVVTLFEAEPYTLWNIRDLGRHSGLQVERSFSFQASAYPGYHHARTLGNVIGRDGEIGGGWKGENRSSRSYVFARKGDVTAPTPGKRKRDDSDSDDD